MADALFGEPRLAALYDPFEPERDDLDHYVAMAGELEAGTVLDIGCGTGTFACRLAAQGRGVTGVDPAAASLEVARRKPFADRVRWVHGDATALPPLRVDLVTMTGNVAQVFLGDDDWRSTLRAGWAALRPDGFLVFETRDPARQAWRAWNRRDSSRRLEVPDVGVVERWVELTEVRPPVVSFRTTFACEADGAVLTSDSSLRFRSRTEIEDDLRATGFVVDDVRDAPDRPGAELVFVARRGRQDDPGPTPPGRPGEWTGT